jgi:hypothetical protein
VKIAGIGPDEIFHRYLTQMGYPAHQGSEQDLSKIMRLEGQTRNNRCNLYPDRHFDSGILDFSQNLKN